jgi:tetrahydromethanopterin S-methyltransferase subunit A
VRRHLPGGLLAAPAALHLGAPQGWVALCTLAERDLPGRLALAARLSRAARPAIALIGPLLTLPRGLARLVANLAALPAIRHLLLCGQDPDGVPAREAIRRLWQAGLTPAGSIPGLPGVPPLRNLDRRSLALVRARVRLTDLGPTRRADWILRAAQRLPRGQGNARRRLLRHLTIRTRPITPRDHGLDPSGYFVILAPTPDKRICCEHYRSDGVLTRRFLGADAAGLCRAIIERGLAGTADHAAYLGRELQKAEDALRAGLPYFQDDPLSFARGRPARRPRVPGPASPTRRARGRRRG